MSWRRHSRSRSSRYYDFGYSDYVSVAERANKATKALAKLEKDGLVIEPLGELSSRLKIANSFWGRAWCKHLESYGDYENRLPRGRTYLRNGSVRHLSITPGAIHAFVMGSELYEQKIRIDPLPAEKWEAIKRRCAGGIGSLIELLQGRISDEIMAVVTDREEGLFPSPKEIHLDCSCPDYATLCKHLAAVLYGVGAKLDKAPELLFTLRGVDHNDLVSMPDAAAGIAGSEGTSRRRTLSSDSLADVFGIEFDDSSPHSPASVPSALAEDPPPTSPALPTPPEVAKPAKVAKKKQPSPLKVPKKSAKAKIPLQAVKPSKPAKSRPLKSRKQPALGKKK